MRMQDVLNYLQQFRQGSGLSTDHAPANPENYIADLRDMLNVPAIDRVASREQMQQVYDFKVKNGLTKAPEPVRTVEDIVREHPLTRQREAEAEQASKGDDFADM